MKTKKVISFILAVILALPLFARRTDAASEVGFQATVSHPLVQVGKSVQAQIALTGYTSQAEAIRGLQVDITGIDPEILAVESYSTLIQDTTAVSNTASFNAANRRVRLAYVQFTGTLPAPCQEVLQVGFRVNENLTEEGSIVLPVTVKIQTLSRQITKTGEITIAYTPEAVSVVSVDITWGTMEFVYDPGTWNPQTHAYENAGWTDNQTGYITVKNTGTEDTVASFSYETERTDVAGSFSENARIDLATEQETTVYLVLSGKPSEELDKTVIGNVTVRIGGE